jgi:membrane-bound lytic murein transglycosylase D
MAANLRLDNPKRSKVLMKKMKFSFYPFVVCFFMAVPSGFGMNPDLPAEGLEQRVAFWKKVFTEYGKDDIVIHYTLHVNLVYDVATDANVNAKATAVRAAIREVAANLDNVDNLSPLARRIHAAIDQQGVELSASRVAALADTIHRQRGIKERFRQGVIRSGKYVEAFKGVFERAGLPHELALLPLVESSFENVRSRVGAVGMWQFMRSTGRLYMTINNRVDERLDPLKATSAAARLLKDNYQALGAWPLAITAYNHGRGGMLRAQKAHGSDLSRIISEYKGPVFGYASMNFYAEFLAAVEIYNSYPTYFGELVLDQPDKPKTAAVQVAKASTPASSADAQKYRVQKGDTLWAIAQRFGTSIANLMDMNSLSNSAIYAGQILQVR